MASNTLRAVHRDPVVLVALVTRDLGFAHPDLVGQFPLVQANGDPHGYEQGTYRAQVADDPEVPPTHPLVPLHLFLELGAEREHRLQGSVYLLLGESQPFELLLYPRWQFGADGEILAGLQGVISAAREAGMGPEELHFFVTEPEERLGGALPLDLLRRGEGGGPPALGRLGTVLG
jgi:hypothetical protein